MGWRATNVSWDDGVHAQNFQPFIMTVPAGAASSATIALLPKPGIVFVTHSQLRSSAVMGMVALCALVAGSGLVRSGLEPTVFR